MSIRIGENIISDGGSSDMYKMYTMSNKTAPSIFNSRLSNLVGGYEIANGYCYIYLKANITSALVSGGNDSWALFNNLPIPVDYTPLNITILDTSLSGDVIQNGGCHVRTDGFIVHRKVATYTTNMQIVLQGMYKIAAT